MTLLEFNKLKKGDQVFACFPRLFLVPERPRLWEPVVVVDLPVGGRILVRLPEDSNDHDYMRLPEELRTPEVHARLCLTQ